MENLEQKLSKFIEMLLYNQNYNCDEEQRDLYTKEDYYKLLNPVISLIKEEDNIDNIRELLFQNSGVIEGVKDIIQTKKIVPGIICSFGTANYRETIIMGNKREVILTEGKLVKSISKMEHDSIFDIASITKIFTSLIVMTLAKEKKLDIQAPISKYDNRFPNIKDVTISELLSFIPLETTYKDEDGKLLLFSDTSNPLIMEKILFSVAKKKQFKVVRDRRYNDLTPMVLKYIIENITGMPFYDVVLKYIIKPLKMKDTNIIINKDKLDRVVSTNYEHKYFRNDNYVFINDSYDGIVNDKKARVMGQNRLLLSGHAGLFSTIDNLVKLSLAIINDDILDKQMIEQITKNRTGKRIKRYKYSQYFGYLCYVKNPSLSNSEVYHALSGCTMAISGFTGMHMTVDYLNKIYIVLGSNKPHNRITVFDKQYKKLIIEDKAIKQKYVIIQGKKIIISQSFVFEKDPLIVRPSIRLSLQYKFLEYIYNIDNKKITNKIRYIEE